MSILSKMMAMIGDPLKGLIKRLGGDAPIDAPGGFRMPRNNTRSGASPAARSMFAKEAAANRTPEQRAAIAKKASESRTPEERSAAAKQTAANRTPEDRAAIAKKAAETRAENQREAARSHKAGQKRAKAEGKAKAKLEEEFGSDKVDGDETAEDLKANREEREKEIQDVIVPGTAREKVFYNQARRSLILDAEEQGIIWVETQHAIEKEARRQREDSYVEADELMWKEQDELAEKNPDLDNPSNYRR